MAASSAATGQPSKVEPLSIHFHSCIHEAQGNHGVSPHQDYAQYTRYCSRKLSRLRHGKLVKKELLHSMIYKSALSTDFKPPAGGTSGRSKGGKESNSSTKLSRHAFRPNDLTKLPPSVLSAHANYFLEPLFLSERSWSASMEWKRASQPGSDRAAPAGLATMAVDVESAASKMTAGQIRGHCIRRLRKAVKYAALLETLTTLREQAEEEEENEGDVSGERGPSLSGVAAVDEQTQMEASAYASWMRGNLALELGHWQAACTEYQTAFNLCLSIANAAVSAGETPAISSNQQNDKTKDSQNKKLQQLELADFFNGRAHHVIAPLLRYCQYELQEKEMSPSEMITFLQSQQSQNKSQQQQQHTNDNPLQSKLDLLKSQTLQNQLASTPKGSTTITFRENVVEVDNKEMRMCLLRIQDLKDDWERAVSEGSDSKNGDDGANNNSNSNSRNSSDNADAKFMSLLSACDDAISLSMQELKHYSSLKSSTNTPTMGPSVNAKKFQLSHVVGYVKCQKLKLLMGRNERMVNDLVGDTIVNNDDSGSNTIKKTDMTLKQLEEIAHLYDALLQDARAVAALPGGGTPENFSIATTTTTTTAAADAIEDEFLLEAKANILRLRSLRCCYIARIHSSVNNFREALALYDQAMSLGNEALEEMEACEDMENAEEMMEHLGEYLEKMKAEKCRVVAMKYLQTVGRLSSPNSASSSGITLSSTSGKTLLHRLEDYDCSGGYSLTNLPPKLEAMACKPTFFDVALNYMSEYPAQELENVIEEHTASMAQSKGILGWFRRG